ncbi:hypothetical protein, partial [Paenibacillus hemerocallicola]|uniref:hypothetical protein n=1 Tax=Paenibacillus hemerocallicola TaxID=1172614 RepID=UPI001C405D9A
MNNYEYTERELIKFTVKYSSSKLTAEQAGIVISQTAVMYKIIQEYLDSPYDLQLVRTSRGSYIFEFLGDPVVLDQIVNICSFIGNQLSDFWGYVGSNVTWDLTKYIGVEVLRKKTELQ